MKLQDKIKARKEEKLKAAAEFSDSALDALAEHSLAQDSIDILTELCDKMHKMVKSANSQAWEQNPKWEYGPVNGLIGKFLTQWIYLPDLLKEHMELNIPIAAFEASDLDAWGKLTRCTPLGDVLSASEPDLDSVSKQIEITKAYLDLPYTPSVITKEQWDKKEAIAKIRAATKANEIELAALEAESNKVEGIPTFTV